MIVLGLGCNVGDRLTNLREALKRINAVSEVKVIQVSPVYESNALLVDGAPKSWEERFLNLAVGISTDLTPEQLLLKTKKIESDMGRASAPKWSPRIIDIDILVWNDDCYSSDKIKIPHPGLIDRPFALWPLADIDPEWKFCDKNSPDVGKSAYDLAKKFGSRFDANAPLHTKQIVHRVDIPLMMGVINLTPDSFSDGGEFDDVSQAIERSRDLFYAGAEIIDVGGESTRPESEPISADEEWSRLKDFLDEWFHFWGNNHCKPQLSIDTYKPAIVEKLLSYDIDFLNDVSGLTNPKMRELAKEINAKIIFMHNLGLPANPKVTLPDDKDVVEEVYRWGQEQVDELVAFGIDKERLIFDVGIGFGKDAGQSLSLITNIKRIRALGIPTMVGHSRKSFLNNFTTKTFAERDLETAAFSSFLADQKVDYLRVHNIDITMRMLKINATFR